MTPAGAEGEGVTSPGMADSLSHMMQRLALALLRYRYGDVSQWHEFTSFWPIRLNDGTLTRDRVMRCRVAGVWRYRKMTDEEARASLQSRAW